MPNLPKHKLNRSREQIAAWRNGLAWVPTDATDCYPSSFSVFGHIDPLHWTISDGVEDRGTTRLLLDGESGDLIVLCRRDLRERSGLLRRRKGPWSRHACELYRGRSISDALTALNDAHAHSDQSRIPAFGGLTIDGLSRCARGCAYQITEIYEWLDAVQAARQLRADVQAKHQLTA